MKLTAAQLSDNLPNAPVYLVSGVDILLVQESCEQIIQYHQRQGFSLSGLITIQSDKDWQALNQANSNFDLFSNNKLLKIKVNAGKLTKTGAGAIQTFLQQTNQAIHLLLIMDKLEPRSQSSTWFKAIDDKGIVTILWPLKPQELPGWIQQRLASLQLKTNDRGIQLLAEYTQGNLLATAQEIEKLALLYGEGSLSTEQIMYALTDNSRYSVFDLVDTWFKNALQCPNILRYLQQEGVMMTLIIWALAREIRTLSRLKFAMRRQTISDSLLKQYGIWSQQRQALIKQHLQQHTLQHYHHYLQQLAYVDQVTKGSITGNPWQCLTDFLVNSELKLASSCSVY